MDAIRIAKIFVSAQIYLVRFIWGRSWAAMSSLVATKSVPILLTRYAPFRMPSLPALDIPERLDRIEPASDPLDPGSRIRGGGANSKPVYSFEARSICLESN
jgi:hypothetical protein